MKQKMIWLILQVAVMLLIIACNTMEENDITNHELQSIPLSEVGNNLNLRVVWNANQRQASLDRGEYHLKLEPDSKIAWFQGEALTMEFPAYLNAKELFIPRSFYEKLKKLVEEKTEPIIIPPEDAGWQVPDELINDPLLTQPINPPNNTSNHIPNKHSITTSNNMPSPASSIYASHQTTTPLQTSIIKPQSFRIVIDAGHGGHDPGAISSQNQFQEKNFTLDIAQQLNQILVKWNCSVTMIRNSDVYVALANRSSLANQTKADCLVSIHLNSASASQATGFELWIHEDQRSRAKQSRRLAQCIQQAMRTKIPIKDRGIRKSNFHILQQTTMPAVLVEAGFMSNASDLQWLCKTTTRQEIAQAIAQGLLSYYNSEIAKIKP